MSHNTRVVFFQVQDSQTKVKKVVETAMFHFEKKEPILFFVEDDQALHFVDELLWKLPKEGFLPHVTSDMPTKDLIVITKTKQNLNQATIAFNLCPSALFTATPFKMIYELEDLTSLGKKNLSSQRFDCYKKAQFVIEARTN